MQLFLMFDILQATQLLVDGLATKLGMEVGYMRTFGESASTSGYANSDTLQERQDLIKQMELDYDETGPGRVVSSYCLCIMQFFVSFLD